MIVAITNQLVRRDLLHSVGLAALQLNSNSAVLRHTRTFFVRCDNFDARLLITLCVTVERQPNVIPACAGMTKTHLIAFIKNV